MRYLLIGMGAAAIGCAEGIRSRDSQGEILLVSEDPDGYYSRPGLAYYLTGELPRSMLFPFQEANFERLNLRRIQARVTALDPAQKQVAILTQHAKQEKSSSLKYDQLLLAVGAAAAPASLPGADLVGVVKLDSLEDAQGMLALARPGRTAVVVGGGITALEIVEGLVERKMQVHYFLRGDRYWSGVLDESESHIVEERLKQHGVHLHFQTELAEIVGQVHKNWLGQPQPARLRAVRTQAGTELACDLLAVAIGVRPRLELARSAGLKIERGVVVDQYLRTNLPGIYAAGDVAQVFDPLSGKGVIDSLWQPARMQGYAAGVNMAGGSLAYVKPPAFNVTRLAGLTTTIIGAVGSGRDVDLSAAAIARGDSETWRQLPDALAAQGGFDVNHLRIIIGERSLLGALVMGDQTLSMPLQRLVSEQVDIRPIRDQLVAPNAPLAEILADFWYQYHQEQLA